jgi:ElaB/YqjD/DUF883 family membrane-anchored ribosome-binding protein
VEIPQKPVDKFLSAAKTETNSSHHRRWTVVKLNGHALNLKEVWNTKKGKVYRQAQRKLKTAGQATTDYIQENPEKSVAISAGLGFILGFFLSHFQRD